jgi:predicted nucleotidyltransferase
VSPLPNADREDARRRTRHLVLPELPAASVTFEELVELARAEDGVLGLVLTGSRAHGRFVTDESDWDVRLVVRDELVDEYRARLGTPHGSRVEVVVMSRSEFERTGDPGTPTAWDRPSYVHAVAVVDTSGGRVSEILERKRTLPPDYARSLAAERLDDYVNAYFRSAKSHRLGLGLEARLDGAESIPPLLDFLFALEGRVRPFNKHLRAELERQPLALATDELLARVGRILSTGDLDAQQELFRDVAPLVRAHGLSDVIDAWEPDVAFLRGE